MCGISGFSWEDESLIKQMNSLLKYRGPDQHGIFSNKNISLGHRRLSIIDLSKNAKQPLFNEKRTVAVVCNGEIYNFKELREMLVSKGHKFSSDTDTEVIVHCYEEYGENFISLLNGIFAFALWDNNKKTLILGRDRMGIKPLYYSITKKGVVFSSEIKALLLHDVSKEIDKENLNLYFMLRYVPSPKTIFKYVFQIPKGTYAVYKDKKLQIKNYYSLSYNYPKKYSENEKAKELRTLFKEVIKNQIMSDVPLGVFLSGGIDSGIITAMMSKLREKPVKTYSIGYNIPGFEDELEKAEKTAAYYNTEHKSIVLDKNPLKLLPEVIWHMDEPVSDPVALPMYELSRHAKKDVSVVLCGEGADEMFGGYEHYKIIPLLNKFRSNLPKTVKTKIFPFLIKNTPKTILNRFFKYSSLMGEEGINRAVCYMNNNKNSLVSDYLTINSIFTEEERSKMLSDNNFKKVSCENVINMQEFGSIRGNLNKLQHIDTSTFMQQLLLKVDKMTMAHGLECRVPYLDNRIVDFASGLHPLLKIKGNSEKYILRKAFASQLPNFLKNREKQRFFVPIHHWFKEYRDFFDEILSKENINHSGILDYGQIKIIYDKFDKSPLYYGRQLWCMLNFQIWHKEFAEEKK